MGDPVAFRIWAGRAVYLLLVCLVLFGRLLPLDALPGGWPLPDLMLAITFAWVLRRPEHLPPLLIVAVFLLFDLVFLRAPGLWTLMVLLATEFLRRRQVPGHDLPFLAEWALVAGVTVAATLAESLVLSLFMLPGTPIGVALLGSLATLVAYPAVTAVLRFGFGLQRAAPGEADALGGR